MTPRARGALRRLFTYNDGGQVRWADNTTVSGRRVNFGDLHALTREALITYEERPESLACFGVRSWCVRLTAKGKELLLEELGLKERAIL